ncbi:MAG TPA: hypothetical protein VFI14_09285 [Chryseosolibacter sp.]|nr:hypothetical protein [Chryseosolibacter sp.]
MDKRINLFFFVVVIFVFPLFGFCQSAKEIKRFKLQMAQQGVAVDGDYFYVINNSSITKHSKEDGREVARWDGKAEGIKHLNSGTIIKEKLYCANSNFPAHPMAGSIEIFDPETLKHTGTHSFGIGHGSVTWIDQKDGFWWIGFAQYSGKNADDGKDTRWTTLVKYTKDWAQVEAWIYPENIIEAFMPMSNSGGSWDDNGYLYCTGHDKPELYVMKLPKSGYTLEHVKTIPATIHGQGIAIDRTVRNKLVIYGLSDRKESSVVVNEIAWDQ